MTGKSLRRFLLLFAGVLLLSALVWRAGPQDILDQLLSVGWGFGILLLLSLAWNTTAALAWRMLFDRNHPTIGWKRLWHTRLAGEAVNTLTPFLNLGGEPVKVWLLKEHLDGDQGATYVVLDKTIYFLASLLYMASGLLLGFLVFTGEPMILGAACALLTVWLVAIGWIIRRQRKGHTILGFMNLLEKIGVKFSHERRERMERIDADLAAFWETHQIRFLMALSLHFLGRVFRAVDVWVIAWLLGMDMNFLAAYVISAAAVIINAAFSFIPGALGAYEGGHGLLLKSLGLGMEGGVSMGILRRVRTLTFAGLSYLLLVFRPDTGNAPAEEGVES
ncbi:MAG: flippase-like domain-containing protein [Chrysiogenetes bacterium]|nr:flippase-like domain-containing protein [Chrysiogenetes bacterium]